MTGFTCRDVDSIYLVSGRRLEQVCTAPAETILHAVDLSSRYGSGTRRPVCARHGLGAALSLAVNRSPGVRYRVTLEALPIFPSQFADDYAWWQA